MSINTIDSNRPSQTELHSNFNAKIEELRDARQRGLHTPHANRRVVILGGGPAGLIRGIQSLIHGNPTLIFEKRRENQNGRENTVRLEKEAIAILNDCGVMQYLIERGLVFPPEKGVVNVRLTDLEQAMKSVIQALSPDQAVIQYDCQARSIDGEENENAHVVIENSAGEQHQINDVAFIVVAEGARSSTNERILQNRRIEVLPPMPVIAAILVDDRPKIQGIASFLSYTGKSVLRVVEMIFYHTFYIFKFIFQKERFSNPERKILGSVILKTPGQDYLGTGLSKEESEKLRSHQHNIEAIKEELATAKERHQTSHVAKLEKELIGAQAKYEKYLKQWVKLSCCASNAINILSFIFSKGKMDLPIELASWFPIRQVSVTDIGSDHSEHFIARIGNAGIMIAGDTAATVDPTTGLGCNTAITTCNAFTQMLDNLEPANLDDLAPNLDSQIMDRVRHMHNKASLIRNLLLSQQNSPNQPAVARA